MNRMPETAIHVERVTKRYGDFVAVNDLSFDVREGEIFAILGPNGAGKSTMIRMILDILKPDEGTITIFGSPITQAMKDRIGYLPEERGLYKNVSIIRMMEYFGTLKGMKASDARSRGLELLEELDLADYADKQASELSKGMQQKVQLAVTVLHQPALIIIDEPFSGLDPVNRLVIKKLLLEFKESGGAIVMSTHQMNQIEEMADRLMMIHHGQRVLYGNLSQVQKDYALHAIELEGEGDWTQLEGVSRVEARGNGDTVKLLYLEENVSADQVLAKIAQNDSMRIERYARAVPTLDEIFIQVAGRDN